MSRHCELAVSTVGHGDGMGPVRQIWNLLVGCQGQQKEQTPEGHGDQWDHVDRGSVEDCLALCPLPVCTNAAALGDADGVFFGAFSLSRCFGDHRPHWRVLSTQNNRTNGFATWAQAPAAASVG